MIMREHRDLGNPILIHERDEALGRAYEWGDQTTTLREYRRKSEMDVLDNMERFGSEFVKTLAHAARIAELNNYERLRMAFPFYWNDFREERCQGYK